MKLAEQVVWITGASSGIGEALALELAGAGARIVVSARRAERLEALRTRCPDPGRVAVLPVDVSETHRAEEHTKGALAAFGRVDVMVHNAGVTQRSLVAETSMDVHRRLMEVNYFGVIALTRALLPAMRARRRGHFVVVSSVAGYVGTQQRSGYAASKHALHGFFDALRAEEHAAGLEVTMVCPGYVATELTVSALSGDGSRHGRAKDPGSRGLPPERCAHAIRRAIESRPKEIYVGGREVAAIYLRRFVPGLLARVLLHAKTT